GIRDFHVTGVQTCALPILGGAVDFTSPTARNSPGSQLFLAAGSHGLRNARVTLGGVSGDFDALVALDAKERDGYREHSRQDRSRSEERRVGKECRSRWVAW